MTGVRPRPRLERDLDNSCLGDDGAGRLLTITPRRLVPRRPPRRPRAGPASDNSGSDVVVCRGGVGVTFRNTRRSVKRLSGKVAFRETSVQSFIGRGTLVLAGAVCGRRTPASTVTDDVHLFVVATRRLITDVAVVVYDRSSQCQRRVGQRVVHRRHRSTSID